MIDEQTSIHRIVTYCLEISQEMLGEYDEVIPFCARTFTDSEEIKMECFQGKNPDANWDELISITAKELIEITKSEKIFATTIVFITETKDGEMNIGIQIDTKKAPVLFIYPYYRKDDQWKIGEAIKADHLIAPRVFN